MAPNVCELPASCWPTSSGPLGASEPGRAETFRHLTAAGFAVSGADAPETRIGVQTLDDGTRFGLVAFGLLILPIILEGAGWIGEGKGRDRWVGVVAGPGQMYHWKRAGAQEPRTPKA